MNGEEALHNRSCRTLLRGEAGLWLVMIAVMVLMMTVPVHAQINPPGSTIYDLVPIGSTGPVTSLSGHDIVIPAGGVVVELELHASGWAATGDGQIAYANAGIDGNIYCSGTGEPLHPVGYPGAPIPSTNQPSPGALTCPFGQGFCRGGLNDGLACQTTAGDCPDDPGQPSVQAACKFGCPSVVDSTCMAGAFIKREVCFAGTNAGIYCVGSGDCPGSFCVANQDYMFSNFSPLTIVSFDGLNYEYFSGSQSGGKADAGLTEMFATLLVVIPTGAAGTYNIDFLADTEITPNGDGLSNSYAVANLNGATITIPTGSCCFNIGPGSTNCQQDISQSACAGLSQPSVFREGQECGPMGGTNQGPDFGNGPCCTTCQSDSDCNDLNFCTDDVCTSCDGCVNTNNFNDATECCDPFSASLTTISDFDVCTADTCNAQTGNVSHDPIVGCTGCVTDIDCFDGNACTNDSCDSATGDCSRTPNFNVELRCCQPSTGSLTVIADIDPCTDDVCNAQTGQVAHNPIAGCIADCTSISAAMAGDCPQNIPAVSEWGLVILSLLLLIGGKLYFGRRRTASSY